MESPLVQPQAKIQQMSLAQGLLTHSHLFLFQNHILLSLQQAAAPGILPPPWDLGGVFTAWHIWEVAGLIPSSLIYIPTAETSYFLFPRCSQAGTFSFSHIQLGKCLKVWLADLSRVPQESGASLARLWSLLGLVSGRCRARCEGRMGSRKNTPYPAQCYISNLV